MTAANGIVLLVATPQIAKASRVRQRRRQQVSGRPFLITILVAAVGIASWLAYGFYRESHVTLVFANGEQPIPPLELTFFPKQFAFTAPSPPAALGQHLIEDQSSVVVGGDVVPGHGVVRYRGEGIGAGFAYLRLGQQQPTIKLRAPQSLRGRIGEPIAYWFMGWRCAGIRPVANAEVVLMGGGEHGIDLVTTHTDVEGRFTVRGFDGELNALGLRVRAPGFAIVHRDVESLEQHAGERAIIAMTPSTPRRGKLQLAVDLEPDTLRLLARGLPGVDTVPTADGSFTLDYIPDEVEARIIVHGLPDDCAQEPARTKRDGLVLVHVVAGATVEGRVLDQLSQPVPGALVWIGENPAVRADSRGCYRLIQNLPGEVTITAQIEKGKRSRARPSIGKRAVQLEPNGHQVDIDILLDR